MLYNWKTAFSDKHFRNRFFISVFVVSIILTGFASLLAYIETRQGHTFYDPILNFIKPRDVSDFIFFATYLTALVGLIYAFVSPYRFLHLIQMYGTLTLLRVVTLFFVPLDPPTAIIPLRDTFLTHTFYAGNENLKDLFFSGHAATLFLFYFFASNKILKYLFLISAVAVSIGVVVQHVHYSYDVLAAPIFAYIAYRVITKFSKHYYSETSTEI
ncbi:MAG: phosphatase PAP2-related protein [Bacteroidota bacterium]